MYTVIQSLGQTTIKDIIKWLFCARPSVFVPSVFVPSLFDLCGQHCILADIYWANIAIKNQMWSPYKNVIQ